MILKQVYYYYIIIIIIITISLMIANANSNTEQKFVPVPRDKAVASFMTIPLFLLSFASLRFLLQTKFPVYLQIEVK